MKIIMNYKVSKKATFTVIRGAIVKEIRQRFTDWATQVIRLYRGEEFVELEWIIGPIPIGTDLGKEVVSIFSTNVSSGGQFFTDSNGRQMMKRTCWNESAVEQQKKPVSSCYYPVVSRLCLHSTNTSVGVCVLTDRAQGGTSYKEGEIELMIHRRLLTDDGFGLEEPLNEEAHGVGLVVRGWHRLVFGDIRQEVDDMTFSERVAAAARRWKLEPWLFMTTADKINRRKWQNVRNKRYSALRVHGLPRHIHVLTLEPWKGGSVLLRLENTMEKSVRGRFSNEKSSGPEDFINKPSHITVQLRRLFTHLKIKRVRETTLAANQWLDDARQMDWSTRYVYQGADDDILPEDNLDSKDDSKPVKDRHEDEENKDPSNYSEEEDYNRRKLQKNKKKGGRKQFGDNFDTLRRKRSVNVTENVLENVINGSFNDKPNGNYFNRNIDNSNNSIEELIDERIQMPRTTSISPTTARAFVTHKVSLHNLETTSNVTIFPEIPLPTVQTNFRHKYIQANRRSARNFNGRKNSKPTRVLMDLNKPVEEVTSSEEDFPLNAKKRSPKRRKFNKNDKKERRAKEIEIPYDAPDDGITRSIFEMYYKAKSSPKAKRRKVKPPRVDGQDGTEKGRRKGRRKLKMRLYKNDDYDGGRSMETTHRIDYEDVVISQTGREEGSDEADRRRQKTLNKSKKLQADVPFFLTERRRQTDMWKRGYDEDSAEIDDIAEGVLKRDLSPPHSRREQQQPPGDEPGVLEDMVDEEHDGEREKRAAVTEDTRDPPRETDPPTGEPEPPDEPDYIITLRPTQIRTFVIYFETAFRAGYTN